MKTSELAIAILAVVVVVVVVFSIVMLADLVATPEKATTSYSTTTSCETKTFEAYGRVLSPRDAFIWLFNLTWMETGTAHLYIRADISSNVPVALVVVRGDDEDIVFSTQPSTRIVDFYSVDLYKGYYGMTLVNPNTVPARITGRIDFVLCTPVPILTTSRSDVTVLKTLAVVLAVLASVLTIVALVGLFLWYTKRRASATTGTSTS